MEFKGTKGKLNVTDNGNGQIAIIGNDLRAIAFIPKLHDEYEAYMKLFSCAPEMLEIIIKVNESLLNDSSTIEQIELRKEVEELIKKATTI